MAVSFSVPKSPKKDIFKIDQFLGVDLTNTGSNIDDVRSPNAENMVRFVPGKVRKRTGYHTKIEFSSDTDINRMKNTSDEFVNCVFDENNNCTLEPYEEGFNIFSSFAFVEAVGSYRLYLVGMTGSVVYWDFLGTEEEPFEDVHSDYNRDFTSKNGFKEIKITKNSDGENDYFRIKGLRICKATTATDDSEWRELPWAPAPEDNGIVHIGSEEDQPIWGCHILKNGTFEGNRVVNVNRALNTSNEFTSFVVPTGGQVIYDIGNLIYTDAEGNFTPIYVEFDYISDGPANIYVCGRGKAGLIVDTEGETRHCSFYIGTGSYSNHECKLYATSETVNIQIKNFSVMYQEDENYHWTPAPEDNDEKFHIADVYNVGSKNYAAIDSYYGTVTATPSNGLVGYVRAVIGDPNTNVKGFVKVSFDLYTNTTTPIEKIEIRLANEEAYLYASDQIFNKNLNSEHIEFYVSTNGDTHYANSIYVYAYVNSTASTTFTARISNIKIQELHSKGSYEISTKYYIYHAGKKLYLRASNSNVASLIFSDANEHLSKSWQLNEKIYILDGKQICSYAIGDINVDVLSQGTGYIPLITIAKSPSGGGTSYQALNMLQPGFYEQFVVTSAQASTVNFQLSFKDLDDKTTKAWVLDSNGNWIQKTEGTHYTINRATGVVTFTTAPGASPITGEDNVKILAYRTVQGYADRIAKCTIGTLFGVGGASDRLFLSGNPDYPNWDFYSEQFDPTYFPDTGYSALGTAASKIVGYAIVNNYLATFKDEFDSSQAIFIREGDLVVDNTQRTSEPAFKIINTLQGNGVIAPYAIGYLQTEPLFLTRSGIYAITAQDITGDKYSQNRSFYLNGLLLKEPNMDNAVAAVFNDQYILALNNKFYILDGLQATRTDKSEPYATRQYVGFYCTNIPTVSIWTDDQALWIGTMHGKVCRFATDIDDLESYNDNGEPIYCCWETPDLDGNLFYKNKSFRYFAIRMMQAMRTSAKLYSRKIGVWQFIKEDRASGVAFDFESIDFELFSFSTDTSEKVVHTKVRVKKTDKARFKIENDRINEPFGLLDLALEYIESGNFKG